MQFEVVHSQNLFSFPQMNNPKTEEFSHILQNAYFKQYFDDIFEASLSPK